MLRAAWCTKEKTRDYAHRGVPIGGLKFVARNTGGMSFMIISALQAQEEPRWSFGFVLTLTSAQISVPGAVLRASASG